jgi:hypothetical protein
MNIKVKDAVRQRERENDMPCYTLLEEPLGEVSLYRCHYQLSPPVFSFQNILPYCKCMLLLYMWKEMNKD